MRWQFLIILLIMVVCIYPQRSGTAQVTTLFVQMSPVDIQQGRTALIRVVAPDNVTRVQILFQGRIAPLYRSAEGDWVGFVVADMNGETGEQNPVQVYSWTGEVANAPQTENIIVRYGGFLTQEFSIPNSQAPLLDPALNQEEINRLIRIYSRRTPEKLWTTFMQPVPGEQSSEFGGIRSYNNGLLRNARHTGIDFRAGTGESVMAAAAGRIVFASTLPIRGNHVIIDHGWGVLTGYSHLSEIYVVPGQLVLEGAIIGAVGTTGRSQGAHLHFEMAVNGLWVDAAQFMTLNVPPPALQLAEAR